ncbi:hypothetical protein [Streptomyces sp. NBC_01565]|uniref:hypothetical protein n=1 Tax=unclassified Streptomyces TaxID=2593676 RepID=UPI002252AFDB|nr:hypothetical protein [Streptomyces sp. NBC_01565]MCX4541577.1 hypothetical protein [Streptomyces sp. NBC_01565]
MAATVLRERLAGFQSLQSDDGRQYFKLRDGNDGAATIWVDALPLEAEGIVATATNTKSQNYVILVSDRLPRELLGRILAHELGELTTVRQRAAEGLTPVPEDLLREGPELPAERELSAADVGRIAELDWLAARSADRGLSSQEQAAARAEFSALLDPYGLRPTATLDDQDAFLSQEEAAVVRFGISVGSMSIHSARLLEDLARPIEQLDRADAAALQASREAAARAERQVAAFIGRREVTMAMPGYDQNGLPLPFDQTGAAAGEWAVWRGQVSTRTEQKIQEQLARGEVPLRRVAIGGGASLSGRDTDALLIDAGGRWHLDPGVGIVQSADQDRDLAQWMGVDPYAAVEDPRDRVPINAVRVWEDQLATQGDVVNGHARLLLGTNGGLIAEINTLNGDGAAAKKPLRVACDGTPVVATGLPPELVPGNIRGKYGVESRGEALRLVGERLRELEGEGVAGAEQLRDSLTRAERGGADTRTVLELLEASQLKDLLRTGRDGGPALRIGNCFGVLEATHKWEAAREDAPGRALMGDEVAENRFNALDADHWIIAGSGGTGVANAEIILQENPNARVTIIGRGDPPAALAHQVQFDQMAAKWGREKGDGRLEFGYASIGEIETVRGEDGRTRFRMTYKTSQEKNAETVTVDADGYVASLGRTNPLPAAVQVLADDVRDRGGRVRGDLLFDRDDQYLGYGLTFDVDGTEHRVDVDGAASWQLPREVFAPDIQQELNQMGLRALPSETGNAAPGFAPVARQSALRARAVAQVRDGDPGAVQRLSAVPDRWKPPKAAPTPTTPAAEVAPVAPETPAATMGLEAPTPRAATVDSATPDPATSATPAGPTTPAPEAAPAGRGAPGAHLWQLGVSRPGRGGPPPRPASGPGPTPPPPETGPRRPGLGPGD